jgi:hypothetical protein
MSKLLTDRDAIFTKAVRALTESVESIAHSETGASRRELIAKSLDDCERWLAKSIGDIERSVGEGVKPEAAPETDDDDLVAEGHHANVVALLLVETGRFPDRASALHFLRNDVRGRAMLERMRSKKRKEIPMTSRAENLQAVVKQAGDIVQFAKFLVTEGDSHGISQDELVDLIGKHAPRPGESSAQTFARNFAAHIELRKAVQIAKMMPIQGDPYAVRIADQDDVDEAIRQLRELGRRQWPTESEAVQFARAFSDPANKWLAERAHQRPGATTYYPMPR